MSTDTTTHETADSQEVENYIAAQPDAARERLELIRSHVKAVVPEATDVISYKIPTFRLHGKNLLHYAAYEHHIGLYAMPDGHVEFEEELSRYKRGKGSVQFPLDQPLPLKLIERIAMFRAGQLN